MRNKYVFTAFMLVGVLLVSLGLTSFYIKENQMETKEEDELTIVTSFYPMYVATLNIIGETQGIRLENLSEPQTGCLHDYQLTPEDMKLLSTADVFVVNGGGIESFLTDVAQAYPDLKIVEACGNLDLLEEDGEENAHAWMSVAYYRQMCAAIAAALEENDPVRATQYMQNLSTYDGKLAELQEEQEEIKAAISGQNIILFHEAYAYVAYDYDLTVTYVMDLDEERQISAGEVADVLSAIQEGKVSYIFAEELYGKDMGDTVTRESEAQVIYLDALNRGDYSADSYLEGMESNIEILKEAFL